MNLHLIAGARPNFLKISSICNSIFKWNKKNQKINFNLIHTGQHFDSNLSKIFFDELNIPTPDTNFNCGGGSRISQISKIMISYEKYLIKNSVPDFLVVVGDVNSTIACSIVAKSFNVKLVHVEAGIRSFDNEMPEEINRTLTDSITDYSFVTSETAINNLINEGFDKKNIFFVGNTMVDTLLQNIVKFKKPNFYDYHNLKNQKYFVLTLHRPSNVDNANKLDELLSFFNNNLNEYKVIFPIHPRTKKNIKLDKKYDNIIYNDPLGYLEFNYLVKNSFAVITDSGGITEETTIMGIPCMTLRDNTERPETINCGTNVLLGTDVNNFNKYFQLLFNNKWKKGKIPIKWDGKTGDRIVNVLFDIYKKSIT